MFVMSSAVREPCSPTAISIDDDFAPCEPSVSLRATNDELARGVDVHVRVVTVQREGGLTVFQNDFRQGLHHHFLNDEPIHLLHARSSGVRPGVASHFAAAPM